MNKLIYVLLFSITLATSNVVIAGATGQDWNDSSGIITPKIANGVMRTNRISIDVNGNMVYCHTKFDFSSSKNTCTDKYEKNAWVLFKDAVPSGRIYVGFKSVSGSYGSHSIEIYWK